MGQIVAIFLKRFHGGPMDSQETAELVPGVGLKGSADRGGRRQVTLVSIERWLELMKQVGSDLGPGARRANLVLSNVNLENSRGRVLRIGSSRLRIGGETRPCEQMEDAAPGLQQAMRERWGGGVFAEVLTAGTVAVGDHVSWDADISSL
jgi:MOSC domain-containing protein YiiM